MNLLPDRFICILYGPTAVGKTELAHGIAQLLPVEIINMDVGQLYTNLSIGTAKPDLSTISVVHHLFNELDVPVDFSVAMYRARITSLLDEIWSRGAVPLLVGGSGFYMRSLFFPPTGAASKDAVQPPVTDGSLWDTLHTIDPARASQIRPTDTYRISRALQIWGTTGILPSVQKPQFDPLANALILHVTRERSELYTRISRRVESMMGQGWIDEVRQLSAHPSWGDFIRRKKLIGYDNILHFISHGGDIAHVTEAIAQRTRHYAKRQETYWRMFEREVGGAVTSSPDTCQIKTESINLTLTSGDIDLYIKRLLNAYRNR